MTYWFRQKRFGFGARPVTWQGWLLCLGFSAVFLLVMLAFLAGAPEELSDARVVWMFITLAIVFVPFIWVAVKKTEGGWRWRPSAEDKAAKQ